MISVAKLFLGFSNWSKVGKAPKSPNEVSQTNEKSPIKGPKTTSHNMIFFFFFILLSDY